MNYHKIEKLSVANGTGIRVVLWVSGCTCYCRGCHNPETWSFNSGTIFDDDAKEELFEALNQSYIQGITFSGGHPLEEKNRPSIFNLMLEIKSKFPHKDIWLYTGYDLTIEDFVDGTDAKRSILSMCDVVVDGKFIEEQKDLTLKWRGSKNQRVIDVKKSIQENNIVLYCD